MAAVISPVSRWHDSGVMGVGPSLWYGPTALDGAAGDWLRAPLGSIYVQIDASGATAQTWQKIAKNGATADWIHFGGLDGLAGGQTIYGGLAANEDLTLEGTAHATKASSFVILQPTSGYVGIGTVTPVSTLSIVDGLTTTGAILTLGTEEPTVDAADILGRINFYAPLEASGTDALLVGASIAAVAEASFTAAVNATSLIFQTGASELATTKMTLTSAGYLGILGTPVTPLHVVGAATITGGIRPAADSTTALTLGNAAGTAVVTVDTTNGRVGIAATAISPDRQLQIVGANPIIEIATATGGARKECSLGLSASAGSLDAYNFAASGMPLHLNPNGGFVGVNTTDGNLPLTALYVAGSATVAANEALVGNTTDDYSAALTLDPAYTGDGIVATVTLNAGGTGYTANDVITVVQAGGAGCTVTVNTVDGSGVITAITLLAGGTGYEVANALATTGGTGTGGKINVTVLTARTVTRHNYIDVNQLALTKGAAVTAAALFRFDAAVGTHKLLLAGGTKTTITTVAAWIPINANGTILNIPAYAVTND